MDPGFVASCAAIIKRSRVLLDPSATCSICGVIPGAGQGGAQHAEALLALVGRYHGRVGMFSNLNLNGRSSARVQPKVGEWGPSGVPTTAAKKRMRIWVTLAFLIALTGLCLLGYHYYKILNGMA